MNLEIEYMGLKLTFPLEVKVISDGDPKDPFPEIRWQVKVVGQNFASSTIVTGTNLHELLVEIKQDIVRLLFRFS